MSLLKVLTVCAIYIFRYESTVSGFNLLVVFVRSMSKIYLGIPIFAYWAFTSL